MQADTEVGALTLHQQVDDDGVEAPGVGGGAGVVARVLGFHRAQHQRPVGLDQAVAVHCHRDGRVLAGGRRRGTSAVCDTARAVQLAPAPQHGSQPTHKSVYLKSTLEVSRW